MIESGITFDYSQLVMDNEFASMIKHMVEGIPVNDETLAVDVIKEIGPFKDFISHAHTFKHMKTASQSQLIDRRTRDAWQALGGKDIYQRSREKAKAILETYQPEPLPENVIENIRSIVKSAEEELGVSGK